MFLIFDHELVFNISIKSLFLFLETEEGFIKVHLTKSGDSVTAMNENKEDNSQILTTDNSDGAVTFSNIRELYQVIIIDLIELSYFKKIYVSLI